MSNETQLDSSVSEAIVRLLRQRLDGLLAVHGFGSRVQGHASRDSDLDVAVLVTGYADPLQLWELSGELSDLAGCSVDLLDLRAASTVMQYQVLTTGVRWWAANAEATEVELAMLSEKFDLDLSRQALLRDIQSRGRVYGG